MGHQEHTMIPCGSTPGCPGTKAVVYIYDDHGNVTSQQSFGCSVCGSQ
jgi:hypothetical protein